MNSNRLVYALLAVSWRSSSTTAAPTVYIPLGAANEVIAVDAASHRIIAEYTGVVNSHGLVATPGYLVAGSLQKTPAPAGAPHGYPCPVVPALPFIRIKRLLAPLARWRFESQAATRVQSYRL